MVMAFHAGNQQRLVLYATRRNRAARNSIRQKFRVKNRSPGQETEFGENIGR